MSRMSFLGSFLLLVVSEEGFIFRAHLRRLVYLRDDSEFTQVDVQSVKGKESVRKAMEGPCNKFLGVVLRALFCTWGLQASDL